MRLQRIETSEDLEVLWNKYSQQFPYAKGLSFVDVVDALRKLLLG